MSKERAGRKTPQATVRPKLSICIPTYNRARYLEKALSDVVAAGAFPFEWEVVISDNCSEDETAAVIAKYSRLSGRVRYFRQPRNRGAEANIISAFRLAMGEFAVYLADDDRLIRDAVVSVVQHMDGNPHLAACFSPWELWNDVTKQPPKLFFEIEQERVFKKTDAIGLFYFITQKNVVPEIAIYRANALHTALHLTHGVHSGFMTLARLLEWGDVSFLPYPFYRYVDVHWEGETRVHHADTVGKNPDYYRGGVECLLYKAFRYQGQTSVPVEQRDTARKMINDFVSGFLSCNVRHMISQKDYIGANDVFWRLMAYGLPASVVSHYGQLLAPRAAAQSLIETFEAMAEVECIGLYRVSDSNAVERSLKEIREGVPIRHISDGVIPEVEDKDRMLVLVGNHMEREKFLKAGYKSGLVVDEQELASQFMP